VKVSVHHVDVKNIDAIIKAGRNIDIVMNATLPKYNLNIMEAALKIGANYEDRASLPEEQLTLSDKWKEAGLTALIACAASLGVTNILARANWLWFYVH
jgi:saccharopine dehydrogenase-like NADP-dependent oxidoreductase